MSENHKPNGFKKLKECAQQKPCLWAGLLHYEEGFTMTEQALRKMIAAGESTRQEFKSWVKCKDYRQRKDLAVKSAVALANTKGGVLLFGVEDDGTITGCPKRTRRH